jgi:hypothetical protein
LCGLCRLRCGGSQRQSCKAQCDGSYESVQVRYSWQRRPGV